MPKHSILNPTAHLASRTDALYSRIERVLKKHVDDLMRPSISKCFSIQNLTPPISFDSQLYARVTTEFPSSNVCSSYVLAGSLAEILLCFP
ncbi:hypothetical protein Smp_165010 [Schistosoma mansoni]|uniref:hypothetical protein n=1 Tax=Schistosoma mansoni TaxID=6183 RepID=UPI0001A62ACF|nr:hypothetical protein Smp_165010 [Schistosoma mansoni]|eukprot:XP_018653118.1 hypothetical protein Smp_165010 [Schistosoma mansoni]